MAKNSMSFKPAKFRIALYIVGIALGSLAAWRLDCVFRHDEDVQNFFVTVYSILIGFLIAVLAVLLDPGVLLRGAWRIAHLQREEMLKRFTRHLFIFYSYLITLALIFLLKVPDALPRQWLVGTSKVAAWLAVASFVWSFDLPIALFVVQRDKFDAIVRARQEPQPK